MQPDKAPKSGNLRFRQARVTPLTSSSWTTSTEGIPSTEAPWLGSAGASSEASKPRAKREVSSLTCFQHLFDGLTQVCQCHCHPQQQNSTTTQPCNLIDDSEFNVYAMPPLNTTQLGKLPDTTLSHLMQFLAATVRRRHPPKRFRNHVYHCLIDKIFIMALQLLPFRSLCWRRFPVIPFAYVMDTDAEAAWRTWSSPLTELGRFSSLNSPDFWLTAVLTRKQRQRLRVLCRALPAELDFEFPVVVRAD